jgi:hypothetical protein
MAVTQLSGPWGKLIDEKNQKTKISCPCIAMASISKRRRNEALLLGFFRYRDEESQLVPKILLSKTNNQSLFDFFKDRSQNEEN